MSECKPLMSARLLNNMVKTVLVEGFEGPPSLLKATTLILPLMKSRSRCRAHQSSFSPPEPSQGESRCSMGGKTTRHSLTFHSRSSVLHPYKIFSLDLSPGSYAACRVFTLPPAVNPIKTGALYPLSRLRWRIWESRQLIGGAPLRVRSKRGPEKTFPLPFEKFLGELLRRKGEEEKSGVLSPHSG